MEYIVGISLALAVSLFATLVGFDRDRVFYPAMTLVVASYYGLFAIVGGSALALSLETAVFSIFVLIAVIGFKTNLWLVAGALVGHGAFDLIHSFLIDNPGLPDWWPMFCLSYDVVAGLYLAVLLSRSVITVKSLPIAAVRSVEAQP
jgi:hypothetical protein